MASNPERQAAPRRIHYALLACLPTAVAVYGSLVPLNYQPLGWHEALDRFADVLAAPLNFGSLSDWAANILLFVPISYLWLGVLAVDCRSLVRTLLACLLLMPVLVTLSFCLEFSQLWFPPRAAISSDIVAQAIGSLIGMALWLCCGQAITDWIRSSPWVRRPKARIQWMLYAYCTALVFHSVMPLDLTISVTQLVHKYREGRIALVPFSHLQTNWSGACSLAGNAAALVPVGMLAAVWSTSRRTCRPQLVKAILIGGGMMAALELGRLLTYSHPVASDDLITGMIGVVIGVWIVRCIKPEALFPAPAVSDRTSFEGRLAVSAPAAGTAGTSGRRLRARWWIVSAMAYGAVLFCIFCAPFDTTHNIEQLKSRYAGFFGVPFAGLQRQHEPDALLEVARKVLFFAPLGGALAMAVLAWQLPGAIRRMFLVTAVLAAGGLGLAIEMSQVFFVAHVPSVTDVILYTVGAAVGAGVAVALNRPPHVSAVRGSECEKRGRHTGRV